MTSDALPVTLVFPDAANGNHWDFCNGSGHTFVNLFFTVNTGSTHIDASEVACTGGDIYQLPCQIKNVPGTNVLDILLSGPPGVPDFHHCPEEGDDRVNSFSQADDEEGCGHFFIDLNCPASATSCGPWPDGTTATGRANVPEPMSAFLLGSGVLVVIRRRYGKRS